MSKTIKAYLKEREKELESLSDVLSRARDCPYSNAYGLTELQDDFITIFTEVFRNAPIHRPEKIKNVFNRIKEKKNG